MLVGRYMHGWYLQMLHLNYYLVKPCNNSTLVISPSVTLKSKRYLVNTYDTTMLIFSSVTFNLLFCGTCNITRWYFSSVLYSICYLVFTYNTTGWFLQVLYFYKYNVHLAYFPWYLWMLKRNYYMVHCLMYTHVCVVVNFFCIILRGALPYLYAWVVEGML